MLKMNFKRIFTFLFALLITSMMMITGCTITKKYTVSFDLNYEGASSAPQSQEIEDGKMATEPIEPVRSGYNFEGWYKEATGMTEYLFATPVTSNITLYAKWEETAETVTYYLAGKFSGYIANDVNFKMIKQAGEGEIYKLTVNLTQEVRDTAYDGHYYKVTNGTWDADGCWGVDNYYIKPAPISPTGGGLGSIWHWANGTLEVTWDATTKTITDTLTISEPIIQPLTNPVIYGDYNSWIIEGENALVLADSDEDGIYVGEKTIPVSTAGEGSSFIVALSQKWYDDQWGQRWGVEEQYIFDGTAATFGLATKIVISEEALYRFSYDSKTHITTYEKVVKDLVVGLQAPSIYGDFNGWAIEGETAFVLKDYNNDGIYVATIDLVASTNATTDYSFIVAESKKYYDDEWGKRWGAEEQYIFDGTAAAMGLATKIVVNENGTYRFVYDSVTHITTYDKVVKDLIVNLEAPTLYGDFSSWSMEGKDAYYLNDADKDGIYEGEFTFKASTVEGGYSFILATSKKFYDDEWGKRWGTEEQYIFDGTAAAMGLATKIVMPTDATYHFVYNSTTHVTTYSIVE